MVTVDGYRMFSTDVGKQLRAPSMYNIRKEFLSEYQGIRVSIQNRVLKRDHVCREAFKKGLVFGG